MEATEAESTYRICFRVSRRSCIHASHEEGNSSVWFAVRRAARGNSEQGFA